MTTLHHNHTIIFHPNSSPPPQSVVDVDDTKWGPSQIGKTSSKGGNHLKSWNQKGGNNHGVFGFSLSLSLSHSRTHMCPSFLILYIHMMLLTYLLPNWVCVKCVLLLPPKHNLIVACLIELQNKLCVEVHFVLKFVFLRLFNKMKNCHMYVCFALCCELFFSLI